MRHAYQFLRVYGYGYGDYAPALCVARQRLAEAKAKLFCDRRLVRDLEEAVRFLDLSCRDQLWVSVTVQDLLDEWK